MMGQAITLVVAAAAAFGLLAAEAEAQVPNGAVYIESDVGDVPGQNSVLAFRRNSNGTLTQTGTFPTGGTGVHPIAASLGNLPATLGPFDSDQDLIFNADATQLFAVNSGSDTIAVFNINTDGSLVPVKGSPFPSGGRQPVSLWFYTDQVDALYKLFKARQLEAARAALDGTPLDSPVAEITQDIYNPFYGGREFGIRDLNGYELFFRKGA